MRKILLISLFAMIYLGAQGQSNDLEDTFTINHKEGSANGVMINYDADVKFRADAPGLGDIRIRCGVMAYEISTFYYNSNRYSSSAKGMPIKINNGQFKLSATVKFLSKNSTGELYISFTERGITKGQLDYYYLSKEEITDLKNKFELKNSSDFNDLKITVTDCKLENVYFEELANYIGQIKNSKKKKVTSTSSSKTTKSTKSKKKKENDDNADSNANDTDDEDSDDDSEDDDEINREASRARAEALKKTDYYHYVYSGINKDDAYRMVQEEKQREQDYKEMRTSLNALGTSVVSYFQNKAKDKEAERINQRKEQKAFKEVLNEKIDRISSANSKHDTELKEYADTHYPLTKNIEVKELIKLQKKRILAIINGHHNVYYPRTFKGNHNSWTEREKIHGYVQQKINKAWFKGNVLHIDVSEELIETEADLTYAPYRYIADVLISYDFDTDRSEIKRRLIWSDQTAIPKSGWLSNNDFNNRLQKINDPKYAVPSSVLFSSHFNSGLSFINGLSLEKKLFLYTLKANKLKKELVKPDYISNYNKTLEKDLEYFDDFFYKTVPFVFFNNELKSSNPKEISVLYLLKNNKYLVFSFPEKEKLDLLFNSNLWRNKQEDYDKHAAYYTVGKQKYRVMNNLSNRHIGGISGEDLLLKNSRQGGKKFALLLNYKYGLLAKELYPPINKYERAYSETFNQSNWNPKVEVGTYTIRYKNNAEIDANLKDQLRKLGAIDADPEDRLWELGGAVYLSSRHLGLNIELVSERTGYISPVKINTYSSKGKRIDDGVYQYKVSNANFYGYAMDFYSFSRRKKEVSFSNLTKLETLEKLNLNPYFSETVMQSYHQQVKSFDTDKLETTKVSDKYIVNGLIHMISQLIQFNYTMSGIKDKGRTKYYNKDGTLKALGLLINNKRYGEWEEYHSNGEIKSCINYRFFTLHGKYDEFDENGRLTVSRNYSIGELKEVVEYTYKDGDNKHFERTYDSDEKLINDKYYIKNVLKESQEYNYENNDVSSTFITYHPDGTIANKESSKERFERGGTTLFNMFKEVGENNAVDAKMNHDVAKHKSTEKDNSTHEVKETPARLLAGEKGYAAYLQENFVYPQRAREYGITGVVQVQFVVEKDGSLSEFKIIKGIHGSCDKEALRLIKECPLKWIPATQNGINLRSEVVVPINFDLN